MVVKCQKTPWSSDWVQFVCPSLKHLGLLSLFSNGKSDPSRFDAKLLASDGSSGGVILIPSSWILTLPGKY